MTSLRYGVFLRPDPATCWAVQQVTEALRRQFGLVSAAAFPPHVTLVGNLATEEPEAGVVAALDPVLASTRAFAVRNAGLRRTGGWVYDVDGDGAGGVNRDLHAVAAAVREAVRPIAVPVADLLVTPFDRARFDAHIGIASHELLLDPALAEEVGEFVRGLPLPDPPAVFEARWYALVAFEADWSARWWEALRWRHVRSWRAT